MIMLVQAINPSDFPTVWLYIYLLLIVGMVVGRLVEQKWFIYAGAIAGQVLFIFALFLFELIDPWCRLYYYRHLVAQPPASVV